MTLFVLCRAVRSIIGFIGVSVPVGPLCAQGSRNSPEVAVGLSAQPDAMRDHGRGGFHFTLLPIGPISGVGLRHQFEGGSSVALRATGSLFLVAQRSITTVSAVNDKPASLVLTSGVVEWATSPQGRFQILLCGGSTHAPSMPRVGNATTPLGCAGISRRLSPTADLRATVDIVGRPIGRSWFQLPVAVSFHPSRPGGR